MAKRERKLQTDDNLAMLENADIVCSVSSDDSCDDEPMVGVTANLATDRRY